MSEEDEELTVEWEREAETWQKAAGYWRERYLERDEYSEELEDKLEEVKQERDEFAEELVQYWEKLKQIEKVITTEMEADCDA